MIEDVKSAVKGDNIDEINKSIEELNKSLSEIGQTVYKQQQNTASTSKPNDNGFEVVDDAK